MAGGAGTDSGLTGFRTQLSGGEDHVHSLWRPGIQKSTWIWITHLLDVPSMEQNTQHIIPKQRNTHRRFDSASALPPPGCAPAPAERSGGQWASSPSQGGWGTGLWGTLINSHVHLIKITLHPNTSFVRTVIGPAERSRGEAERKGRLEWHSDI